MVKITADLIYKCPQYFNPIRERELDLRGNKIAVIENLGATEDQFDCVDLSDNEIVKLENFPYLKRLTTLLINNNRIARINPNIGEFLPKLHTLILTNNRLVNLTDLDSLSALPSLRTLSLLDNLVTKKTNYRLYVIYKLKNLRLLDFRKVKQKERMEAEKMFATKELVEEAVKEPVKTFTPGEVPMDKDATTDNEMPKKVAPTPEQILAIKAAIANSQTLEEVARLEMALRSGQLPADLNISDNNVNMDSSENPVHDKMDTDEPNKVAATDVGLENQMEASNNQSIENRDADETMQNLPENQTVISTDQNNNAEKEAAKSDNSAMEE